MKSKYLTGLILIVAVFGALLVVPSLADYQEGKGEQDHEQLGDCNCGSECECEKQQTREQLMNSEIKQEQKCKCLNSAGECMQHQNNNCHQHQYQKGTE
jgi:hypothetical protein